MQLFLPWWKRECWLYFRRNELFDRIDASVLQPWGKQERSYLNGSYVRVLQFCNIFQTILSQCSSLLMSYTPPLGSLACPLFCRSCWIIFQYLFSLRNNIKNKINVNKCQRKLGARTTMWFARYVDMSDRTEIQLQNATKFGYKIIINDHFYLDFTINRFRTVRSKQNGTDCHDE